MLTSFAELVASRLPAVGLGHFAGVALVEAHAGEHGAAGRLDPRGQAHAIGVGLDLRAGHDQQRDRSRGGRRAGGRPAASRPGSAAAPRTPPGRRSRRARDSVRWNARMSASPTSWVGSDRPRPTTSSSALRLGRDPGDVEQRDRAVARHRRAEMLQLVGAGDALDARPATRHLPIVAGEPADDGAQRAPIVELARRRARH